MKRIFAACFVVSLLLLVLLGTDQPAEGCTVCRGSFCVLFTNFGNCTACQENGNLCTNGCGSCSLNHCNVPCLSSKSGTLEEPMALGVDNGAAGIGARECVVVAETFKAPSKQWLERIRSHSPTMADVVGNGKVAFGMPSQECANHRTGTGEAADGEDFHWLILVTKRDVEYELETDDTHHREKLIVDHGKWTLTRDSVLLAEEELPGD